MLRVLPLEQTVPISLSNLLRRILRTLIMAASMFFMMRAELLLRTSPLAAALMSAALTAGQSPAALVLGCLSGAFRLPLSQTALLPIISCALVLIQALLLELPPFRRRFQPENICSLSAGIAVLLPAMVVAGGDPLFSFQALASGALAAAAAPFLYALLAKRNYRRPFSLPEKTGIALLLGGWIAALQQFFSPAAMGICSLIILLLPRPETGMIVGLALAAGGTGSKPIVGFTLCAWIAGSSLFSRRWQRALSACLTAGFVQLMDGAEAAGMQWMICAAAIWMLLPDRWIDPINESLNERRKHKFSSEEVAREATRDTRRRLTALSEAFSAMADGCVAAVDVPDEQQLICEMRSRLCAGCSCYGSCWAGEDNRAVRLLCGLIGEALSRIDAPPGLRILYSDGEIPPDILRICRRGRMIPDRLGLLLRDFAEKRRSEIKRCANGQLMSIQFLQAKEILLNLARPNPVSSNTAQLRSALAQAGLADCEAVFSTASVSLLRADSSWTRNEISRAARAIGRTLGGKYLPRTDGEALYFVRAPQLCADTGSSCQSGTAGEISGDSHLIRTLGEDKLMLAISDGMGSGEAASSESREALRLLWSFLNAGISRTLALETVNRQLLMKSSEDMFATIDLCIVDLNSGIAEFTKLAASPTLILRGKEMLHVDGGRLPLGILENVQPCVRRMKLRPGDMLVMGSDGVMEAGDGLNIERCARENAASSPDQLAEELVRQAALQRNEDRRDDLTCICLRIGKRNAS